MLSDRLKFEGTWNVCILLTRPETVCLRMILEKESPELPVTFRADQEIPANP
jgi:hypothetical protein